MNVIILLVGCSLLVAAGFLIAFLKALKKGQYDDLSTPPIRMLFESESESESELEKDRSDLSHDRGEQ